MDAGYNAEHFVDFCSKGYDLEQLESWSMQQVKDVVELFIQQEQQRRRD